MSSLQSPFAAARPWVRIPQNAFSCRVRLFCLPYAGGSASVFARWPAGLPADVHVCAIQLPGRQNRLAEPPLTTMEPLVAALAQVIAKLDDVPFALFGHSMGGLIVFELARELRRIGAATPVALVASGCRAPHLPTDIPRLAALPADSFVDALRRFKGIPTSVIDHPELIEILLPTLRSDFQICESYRYTPGAPLDCPIFAYGGGGMGDVTFDQLIAWRSHTSGAFRIRRFPGSHFFIEESRTELLDALSQDLANR